MRFIDQELLIFARRVTRKVARRFGIKYHGVHSVDKRRHEYKQFLGLTGQDSNGKIIIELCFNKRHLKIEELLDTIAHELAHVATYKEKAHHSRNWKAWYLKLKGYIHAKLL